MRHEGTRGERRYSSYSFSTLALGGGEWSASHPGHALAPGIGPPVPIVQEAGWAPESVWTQRLQEKSFCHCRGSNLDHPVVQPVARHCTDWAAQLTLNRAAYSINLVHHIKLHNTSILAKRAGHMNQIIREVTEIELHPSNTNREDGFSLIGSWKPLICNLREQSRLSPRTWYPTLGHFSYFSLYSVPKLTNSVAQEPKGSSPHSNSSPLVPILSQWNPIYHSPKPISLRYISTKPLYTFLSSPMCATCPARLICLDLIYQIIFGDEYTLLCTQPL
jgi:hypothetical protein